MGQSPNNIKDFRPLAAEWLPQGRGHAGLILLPSTRTPTCSAIAAVAAAIENALRGHPAGLSGSERWIGLCRTHKGPDAQRALPRTCSVQPAMAQAACLRSCLIHPRP